jgi:hypothetical protein
MNRPAIALLLALLLAGCSTLPVSRSIDPAALPDPDTAQRIGEGVRYLHHTGEESPSWPPFHLLILDTDRNAGVRPLEPFPRGSTAKAALKLARDQRGSRAIAVVNGSPFAWTGLPFISRLRAVTAWNLGGSEYGSAEKSWGYLSFDGRRYRISGSREDLSQDTEWFVGGYLSIIENSRNIGIHGERHARTALGTSEASRYLYILVVEGDSPADPGLSSRETAEILLYYGAEEAINLDGGNSSALAIFTEGGVQVPYRGRRRRLPLYIAVGEGE